MNELMNVMQKQIDACNAIMIFGVHRRSFQSFSLIKSWVQNRVFTKFPSLTELGKRMSMQNKESDFSSHDLIEVEFSKVT